MASCTISSSFPSSGYVMPTLSARDIHTRALHLAKGKEEEVPHLASLSGTRPQGQQKWLSACVIKSLKYICSALNQPRKCHLCNSSRKDRRLGKVQKSPRDTERAHTITHKDFVLEIQRNVL